jgi:hypothetical protein
MLKCSKIATLPLKMCILFDTHFYFALCHESEGL